MLLALRSLWEEQTSDVTVYLTGVEANCAIGSGTVQGAATSGGAWPIGIVQPVQAYSVRAYRRGKHARAFAKIGKGTVLTERPRAVVIERRSRVRDRPTSAIGIGSLAIDTWIALERSRPAFAAIGQPAAAHVQFVMQRRDDVIVGIASGDRALAFVGSGQVKRKVDFLDEELVALLLAA